MMVARSNERTLRRNGEAVTYLADGLVPTQSAMTQQYARRGKQEQRHADEAPLRERGNGIADAEITADGFVDRVEGYRSVETS